ncbi:MAG: peptide deformylase [Planctomycetota bacterium]
MWLSTDFAELRVVCYPDPVLREHCRPVLEFGPPLQALAERMLELMREGKGVGLAAPQVGLPIRLFVCNPTDDPVQDRICVNPQLTDLAGSVEADEGCLSLPEVTVPMRRAQSATLTACDAFGKRFCVAGVDLEARVWQHENDHLEGRLIVDSMPTSAELANRRILKQLGEEYRARKKKQVARR